MPGPVPSADRRGRRHAKASVPPRAMAGRQLERTLPAGDHPYRRQGCRHGQEPRPAAQPACRPRCSSPRLRPRPGTPAPARQPAAAPCGRRQRTASRGEAAPRSGYGSPRPSQPRPPGDAAGAATPAVDGEAGRRLRTGPAAAGRRAPALTAEAEALPPSPGGEGSASFRQVRRRRPRATRPAGR